MLGKRREETVRAIGVISDTHGLLRPQAVAALRGSALILHAGDVGDPAILEELGRIAPVHAVHGNTDWGELRRGLPRTAVVDLGSPDGEVREGPRDEGAPVGRALGSSGDAADYGPLAYLHHGDRELDLDPAGAGIALVVNGHTHRPLVEERGGVLYLNPGSAGPRRFSLPVTVARVWVEGGRVVRVEVVPLDVGG
jgi:predicted phosphodiesterase